MVELVDSPASGAGARKGVRVRLPPRAPERHNESCVFLFLVDPAKTGKALGIPEKSGFQGLFCIFLVALHLPLQSFCNGDQVVQLVAAQIFGRAEKFGGFCGVHRLRIEKLFGCYIQIVADIKENGHRRIIDPVFDVVDVPGALADGQAHIPGGYAFVHAQRHQSVDEIGLFHVQHHLTVSNFTTEQGVIYPVYLVTLLDLSN